MSQFLPDDQVCEAYRRHDHSLPRDVAVDPASLELAARYDALAHELDLREALGLECDESSLALSVANA